MKEIRAMIKHTKAPMLAQADGELHSGDEKNFDTQDAELPEQMSRRRSSFTALVGQASGLRDLLRRCEVTSAPSAEHALCCTELRSWVLDSRALLESKNVQLYSGFCSLMHHADSQLACSVRRTSFSRVPGGSRRSTGYRPMADSGGPGTLATLISGVPADLGLPLGEPMRRRTKSTAHDHRSETRLSAGTPARRQSVSHMHSQSTSAGGLLQA